MTSRRLGLGLVVALVLAATACGSREGVTGPSVLGSGGTTQSVADLPPINGNPGYSCPSEAPTPFVVTVDGPVNGLWKFTFEWRPTGVNVTSYQLETKKRELGSGLMFPATTSTLDGRAVHVRYLPEGIYHFRVRASCSAEAKWSVEVVKNAGVGAI